MSGLNSDLKVVNESVRKLYEAQQKFKEMEKYYEEVKKKETLAISNFLFTHCSKDAKSFETILDEGEKYYTNHLKLSVRKVERTKVIWNIKKLKEKMSKEKYKEVVDSKYIISDYQGLTEYLRECGVSPKMFKSFVSLEENLDVSALEQLYETGGIKPKELKECYTIDVGSSYIKLTELKDG